MLPIIISSIFSLLLSIFSFLAYKKSVEDIFQTIINFRLIKPDKDEYQNIQFNRVKLYVYELFLSRNILFSNFVRNHWQFSKLCYNIVYEESYKICADILLPYFEQQLKDYDFIHKSNLISLLNNPDSTIKKEEVKAFNEILYKTVQYFYIKFPYIFKRILIPYSKEFINKLENTKDVGYKENLKAIFRDISYLTLF